MHPHSSKKSSGEEEIAQVRKAHLVGRFKVPLSQTQNHPDQRALDETWVDELVNRFSDKELLNRALHPIGVALQDDKQAEDLRKLAAASGGAVPDLPHGVVVVVFAGQHRLAMLPRLALEGPDNLWWHGDVYMHRLEQDHPAEFLTMMHESNTRQILKPSDDVDLFRAGVKLKALLDQDVIDKETFLLNRRALLGHSETTSRAISNLTRNSELAGAITEALSRAHIAKVFQAGGWKKLTTGRLYVVRKHNGSWCGEALTSQQVAAGLVREMTAQVDLLTKGMSEVPSDAMTLPPRMCRVSLLESRAEQKKNRRHPWDALPGGLAAALSRARARPTNFVTILNPKTADPWSLPDVVLLPTSMGASVVEEELKALHRVMLHVSPSTNPRTPDAQPSPTGWQLLKMCAREDQFEQYTNSNPNPIEVEVDHPAGMIAYVLRHQRGDAKQIQGYEQKIVQHAWKARAALNNELDKHGIPDPQTATAEHYALLVRMSEPWWELLRLFKARKLPFRFCLTIPREFGSAEPREVTQEEESAGGPSGQGGPSRKRQRELENGETTPAKRVRRAGSAEAGQGSNSPSEGAREGDVNEEQRVNLGGLLETGELDGSEVGEHGLPSEQAEGNGSARGQANEEVEGDTGDLGMFVSSDDDVSEDEEQRNGHGIARLPERRGGDRRLDKVLDEVRGVATGMTWEESRATASVLQRILEARRLGKIKEMATALDEKATKVLGKFERKVCEARRSFADD
ncbi:hypothetical protein FS749_016285 [Ceratobasidium sp. UAMH 11750]|nr:hypothetical protein FS749_016285 [Ceratobasidium sp. UAMH 11750]